MKKLHLVCNAHLDPIWQWEWEEGAASALSTYQSAVNLLKEYNYVFCHNEANLYKYIERYAPELFSEVQTCVSEGKWKLMGGWYLQPDCLMPTGEGIVRQIQEGRLYFEEKFHTFPKTAINFDPFGHSRGLVQIVSKCGQENYMFMRPYSEWAREQLKLASEVFTWEGYDGSKIKACRITAYNSALGHAREKIERDIELRKDYDIYCSTWGVGNHGGGPSRKDLQDIGTLMKESDIEIVHSDPDTFFSEVNPDVVFSGSLIPCMPGCYTSMANLKQKYRDLERQLFFTEKIASIASLKGVMKYPDNIFREVTEDMLNIQFHDILPGDMIRAGEENGMNYANHGLQLLNQVRADAFFGMCRGQAVAEEKTYPIMVFNPKAYEGYQYVTIDLSIVEEGCPYLGNDVAVMEVYDMDGNKLLSQDIKEESNISMEWRKKVIFKAWLKPLSINRFTIKYIWDVRKSYPVNEDVVFENDTKYIKISAQTGLIESYKVNGKELAKGPLFAPYLYDDYEDPWGMNYTYVGWNEKPFVKMEKPHGIFENLQSFEIIEDGDIYLGCEAFFECGDTKVRIGYKIYKEGDMVDVEYNVFPSEGNKCIKAHIPLVGSNHVGEQIFGMEELFEDGRECVSQNFIALKQEDETYVEVITPSSYGSSYKDGVLRATLMRTATYCAHPVPDRPLTRSNIFINRVDQGQRDFYFRLTTAKENELKMKADLFTEKPYALNIFPTIDKKKDNGALISMSNPFVNVVTIKNGVQKEGIIFRLQNNSSGVEKTILRVNEVEQELVFSKFEVKTVLYKDGVITELDQMLI